jgi:hypothetical protein
MTDFLYTDAEVNLDSSAIYALYYDQEDEKLLVVFNRGDAYVYTDVPAHVFRDAVESSSVGTYYQRVLRGRFHGYRVPDFEDLSVELRPVTQSTETTVSSSTGPHLTYTSTSTALVPERTPAPTMDFSGPAQQMRDYAHLMLEMADRIEAL